jgi:hypothetical protein
MLPLLGCSLRDGTWTPAKRSNTINKLEQEQATAAAYLSTVLSAGVSSSLTRLMGEIGERARFLPFVRLGGRTPSSGEGMASDSYSTLTGGVKAVSLLGLLKNGNVDWLTQRSKVEPTWCLTNQKSLTSILQV